MVVYAFGAPMNGRTFTASNYRYSFNGKENDDETYGAGGEYDYGLRMYDSRLGRFLSVDPLEGEYPFNSTYAYAENDVIRSKDLDGAEKDNSTYQPSMVMQIEPPTQDRLKPKPNTFPSTPKGYVNRAEPAAGWFSEAWDYITSDHYFHGASGADRTGVQTDIRKEPITQKTYFHDGQTISDILGILKPIYGYQKGKETKEVMKEGEDEAKKLAEEEGENKAIKKAKEALNNGYTQQEGDENEYKDFGESRIYRNAKTKVVKEIYLFNEGGEGSNYHIKPSNPKFGTAIKNAFNYAKSNAKSRTAPVPRMNSKASF